MGREKKKRKRLLVGLKRGTRYLFVLRIRFCATEAGRDLALELYHATRNDTRGCRRMRGRDAEMFEEACLGGTRDIYSTAGDGGTRPDQWKKERANSRLPGCGYLRQKGS